MFPFVATCFWRFVFDFNLPFSMSSADTSLCFDLVFWAWKLDSWVTTRQPKLMCHISCLCALLVSAVLTWLAGAWTWSVLHPASPRYSHLSAPRHADVPRTVLIAETLLQFRLWLLSVFQKRAFICKVLGKLKLHCLLVLSGEGWKFMLFLLLFLRVFFCWFGFLSRSGIVPRRSPCSVVCHRILLVRS